MTYNIHPIFVHFPLALLVIYSIVKVIPFYKWFPQVAWKQIERAFLLLGVLGGFISLYTGEIAEHLIQADHGLVEMHSAFATVSVWLYGALLVGEIIAVLLTKYALPEIVKKIGSILTNRWVGIVVALCALLTISIAGLLGGVLVYGSSADPVAPFVLKLLGL